MLNEIALYSYVLGRVSNDDGVLRKIDGMQASSPSVS